MAQFNSIYIAITILQITFIWRTYTGQFIGEPNIHVSVWEAPVEATDEKSRDGSERRSTGALRGLLSCCGGVRAIWLRSAVYEPTTGGPARQTKMSPAEWAALSSATKMAAHVVMTASCRSNSRGLHKASHCTPVSLYTGDTFI